MTLHLCKLSFNTLILIILMVTLSSCCSFKYSTDMNLPVKANAFDDEVKFYIVSGTVKLPALHGFDKKESLNPVSMAELELTTEKIRKQAIMMYPEIFTDNESGIPIYYQLAFDYNKSELYMAMIEVILVGLWFPLWESDFYKVNIQVVDKQTGLYINHTENFTCYYTRWISFYTPLGLIPIPGKSDDPRYISTMWRLADGMQRIFSLSRKCIVSSMVSAINKGNKNEIQKAYKIRTYKE